MSRRKLSEEEVETSVVRLLEALDKGSSMGRNQLANILGERGEEAFRRLCKRLMPECVRWGAEEFNNAPPDAEVNWLGPACAGFAGWLLANYARNSSDPQLAVDYLTGMTGIVASLMVEFAKVIPGAKLDPQKETP